MSSRIIDRNIYIPPSKDVWKQPVCAVHVFCIFPAELCFQRLFLHSYPYTVANHAAEKDEANSGNISKRQSNAQQAKYAPRIRRMTNRMIWTGCDQMLPCRRLYMKCKGSFQDQHGIDTNHNPRRNKNSSNIRNERRKNQPPKRRRRSLTDGADADKQANGKVAIQQPLCSAVVLCGMFAAIALHRIKENKQL